MIDKTEIEIIVNKYQFEIHEYFQNDKIPNPIWDKIWKEIFSFYSGEYGNEFEKLDGLEITTSLEDKIRFELSEDKSYIFLNKI